MRNRLRPLGVGLPLLGAVICFNAGLAVVQADDAQNPGDKASALLKVFADEFVAITPGTGKFPASFQMGSANDAAHESPAHEVTFKYTFAMARYEVPQDLYQAVMGNNPSRWKGPRNSVEMMSWKDANEFCRKATAAMRASKLIKEDEIIRLPTEAEWEYCCRAGTTTRYSFGDDIETGDDEFDVVLTGFGENKIGLIKFVREQTGLGLKEAKDLVESLPKPLKKGLSSDEAEKLAEEVDAAGGTCKLKKVTLLDKHAWHNGNAAGNDPPVGALKPNPWGLYDMHGYLWEFTADAWSDNYEQAPTDGSAAKADADTGSIVMRSGSWKDKFDKLTSTARRKYSVKDADDAVGFRCVKARTP
jgi:ribosomal protein L7/L12